MRFSPATFLPEKIKLKDPDQGWGWITTGLTTLTFPGVPSSPRTPVGPRCPYRRCGANRRRLHRRRDEKYCHPSGPRRPLGRDITGSSVVPIGQQVAVSSPHSVDAVLTDRLIANVQSWPNQSVARHLAAQAGRLEPANILPEKRKKKSCHPPNPTTIGLPTLTLPGVPLSP